MSSPVHPAPLEWTPERIAAFWDFQSRFPDTYFGHRHGAALAALLGRLAPRGAAVLDFGTGPGFLLPHLLRAGFAVTACDISPASIENAARIGAGQRGFAGAFLSTDPAFRAKRFDAVLMTELVEHVEEPLLGEILAEIRQLLRRGGQLLVTTPNEEDLAAEQVFCPCCGSLFHRWQHVRSWSRQSLSDRLVQAGFLPGEAGITDFALEPPRGGLRVRLARLRARLDGRRPPHLWALARAPE
jgi:SAM-dependent methyltransferase